MWDKEQTPETADTKQEGIHQDLQENHWTGDCEANCQMYCWVAKNQDLDIMDGSAPSEVEKRLHTRVRGGNVRALATMNIGRKKGKEEV
jgi:hypothetical protein